MNSRMFLLLVGGFLLLFAIRFWQALRVRRRMERLAQESRDRDEVLFQSMFPELQPWFHPQQMVDFAVARQLQPEAGTSWRWNKPAGFAAADYADCRPDSKGERLKMMNAANEFLTEFVYDTHPEGAVIRVGNGKLTVDIRDITNPRVRYWHPQREFKWSKKGWIFKTPVTDEPFSSTDMTSSSSSETLSSTSNFTGSGGDSGGAGASGGWDDGGGGKMQSAGSTSSVAATAATVALATGVALAAAESGASTDNAGGTAY